MKNEIRRLEVSKFIFYYRKPIKYEEKKLENRLFSICLLENLSRYSWNEALKDKNIWNGRSSKKGIFLSEWMLAFWGKTQW